MMSDLYENDFDEMPTPSSEELSQDAPPENENEYNEVDETPRKSSLEFEDLTLFQAFELLLYRPLKVGRQLWRVILSPDPNLEPENSEDDQHYLKADKSINDDLLSAQAPVFPLKNYFKVDSVQFIFAF